MEGTVKFKNSKTLALNVAGFGFWACRVSMIAGVGIPSPEIPSKPVSDKGLQIGGFEAVPCDERDANKEATVDDSDIVIDGQPAQGWKCGGCGVVIYSINQPRCEECKRLMKKWNRADKTELTEAEQLADEGNKPHCLVADDPEASDVPDETEFEKTEAELEAERAI